MVLTLFDVLPILSLLGKHDSSSSAATLFNITCFKQEGLLQNHQDALPLRVNSGVFLHVITFNLSCFFHLVNFRPAAFTPSGSRLSKSCMITDPEFFDSSLIHLNLLWGPVKCHPSFGSTAAFHFYSLPSLTIVAMSNMSCSLTPLIPLPGYFTVLVVL